MKRSRYRLAIWLFAVCVGLAATMTAAPTRAELLLSNRAALSFEYDDNVFLANRNLRADALGRLFCDFGLNWWPTGEHELLTDYQLGGKLYTRESDVNTIINQLQLGYTNFQISQMYLGLLATGKLRNVQSGLEDYFKFIGEAFVGRRFGPSFSAEIRAAYSQFDFRSFDYYDYWTQSYGLDLRYERLRSFTVGTGYRFTRKAFPFKALENIGTSDSVLLVESDDQRFDNLHELSAFGRYQTLLFGRAPFLVSGSYLFQIFDSNSYGDSYRNHRFMVALSQDLFEGANLHVLGIFQVREENDEVQIPHSYLIEEDDENYNQVQIRLTHSFTDYLSVFAEYSRYWSHYVGGDLDFVKNNYALGVAVSF